MNDQVVSTAELSPLPGDSELGVFCSYLLDSEDLATSSSSAPSSANTTRKSNPEPFALSRIRNGVSIDVQTASCNTSAGCLYSRSLIDRPSIDVEPKSLSIELLWRCPRSARHGT